MHGMAVTQDISEIKDFYDGASIFVTGGTGFLGKLIIEKLLRSCPRIKKIYVLCRPKRGIEIKNRLVRLFDDILFELVRKTDPEFQSKIIPIQGDCSEINLGINQEDMKTLINEVNVIFHCAATIRFDEPLHKAVRINVRSTRDLTLLARDMKQLKAFVYLSTAFSNCMHNYLEEKSYEPPMNSDKLITLLDIFDDDMLNCLTLRLIGKYPNTYTYTKAIAENIIKQNSSTLPICIVRPSAVISTSKEPIAGWCDSATGAIRIAADCFQGKLHILHCNVSASVPMVPGDYVANVCLVAAWKVAQIWNMHVKNETTNSNAFGSYDEILIYNHTSCAKHALNWGEYMKSVVKYSDLLPTLNCLWTCFLVLTENRYVYLFYQFLLHFLPAYIHNCLLFSIGKKSSLIKDYKRIHKMGDLSSYFITREWKFETNNTQNLYAELNDTDKILFNFDMSKMNWSEYMESYIAGIRVCILKDPLSSLPRAKRRYATLKVINKMLLIVLLSSFFIYMWFLLW